MAKKVLMLAGDFTEDYETMVPFQSIWMPVIRKSSMKRQA